MGGNVTTPKQASVAYCQFGLTTPLALADRLPHDYGSFTTTFFSFSRLSPIKHCTLIHVYFVSLNYNLLGITNQTLLKYS